jgi:hypothetical protein
MTAYVRCLLAGLLLAGNAVGIGAYEAGEPGDCAGAAERFVFSWPISDDCHDRAAAPRPARR